MVRKDQRPGKLTLALRRLLLKDVAGEGVTRANLAARGQLKALLRTGMGLHLRHKFVLLKQIRLGSSFWGVRSVGARSPTATGVAPPHISTCPARLDGEPLSEPLQVLSPHLRRAHTKLSRRTGAGPAPTRRPRSTAASNRQSRSRWASLTVGGPKAASNRQSRRVVPSLSIRGRSRSENSTLPGN